MSLKIISKIVLSMSLVGVGMAGIGSVAFADGWDPGTSALNRGSVAETRHNLMVDYNPQGYNMNWARNDYGEVCVYCHTPHGANKQINAPLWNRTVNDAGTYSLYNRPTTLGDLKTRLKPPGPNSLTCLSCHDGTIAIDSILNMPGSGGYGNDEINAGSPNIAFLDSWPNAGKPGTVGSHFTLGPELGRGTSQAGTNCGMCHNRWSAAVGLVPDYSAFMLGTDLSNDHVVGITFPTAFGPGIDYNKPATATDGQAFFDTNGNGFVEKYEVRLYDSGAGPAVECASCHDPHGIPSDGAGTKFIPSFLRISNSTANGDGAGGPSGLCLTCHSK